MGLSEPKPQPTLLQGSPCSCSPSWHCSEDANMAGILISTDDRSSPVGAGWKLTTLVQYCLGTA